MSQHYPPENTRDQIWERMFMDDITGFLVLERFAVRDLDGYLRDRRDLGDPDADWLRRTHRSRTEKGDPEP